MLEFEEEIKPVTDMPALRFGSLIHKALAKYYKPGIKRGIHPTITFEREYDKQVTELGDRFGQRVMREAEDDEAWVDARELGISMMDRYIDHYGKDEQWEVIVTEQPFKQLVYKPWTVDPNPPEVQQQAEPWFWYVGILDGIWRYRPTKKLHIVDHKTAKTIELRYLVMDDQATAYWTWGLDWVYEKGLLRPTQKPAGMLFNIIRKGMPDDRPQNEQGLFLNNDGSISKRQPAPYFARPPIYRDFNERENARQRVFEEFADVEAVRNDPESRAYKNPGQFTCPSCWALDICELHEIGADFQEMKGQTTHKWEPYAEHEIYEGR